MTIETPQIETPQAESPNINQANFHAVILRLAKRVDGEKNKFFKFLTYGLPTLDMVIPGAPAPDSWDSDTIKEGEESAEIKTPVYNNPQLEYLQIALTQRVQGIARSRDNASMEPAINWEQLLETAGGTKYPAQLSAFKKGMAEFLIGQESLTDKQQAVILSYIDTRRLSALDHAKKARIWVWCEKFIEAIGDQKSEVAAVISNLEKAVSVADDEIDF